VTAPVSLRLRFGEYVVDIGAVEIRRDGALVPVEPQVFGVLAVLLRERHRVVTKEEILDEVWGTRMVSESALTSRIKALRRALGGDGRAQTVIRTAHGRGFRFVADVSDAEDGRTPSRAADLVAESRVAPEPDPLEQDIRICTAADGTRLAYSVMGDGPPLVKAANWLTHLEYDLESPVWRHWHRDLSRHHRLLRYDERGCGLSDIDTDEFSVDAWVRDIETVVDAAGLDRFPLLGISQGGAVAVEFAVRHPERVTKLVLYGAFAKGPLLRARTPEQERQAALMIELAALGWGRREPVFRQVGPLARPRPPSRALPRGSRVRGSGGCRSGRVRSGVQQDHQVLDLALPRRTPRDASRAGGADQ
jgi:DNA-binding winged helix-turn-helix (wHTH) protein/pimeloyl-ACP methyl ester carboxylesterase